MSDKFSEKFSNLLDSLSVNQYFAFCFIGLLFATLLGSGIAIIVHSLFGNFGAYIFLLLFVSAFGTYMNKRIK